MKKLKLLFLAFTPFIIGELLGYAMGKFDWYGGIITAISILFFAYWFFIGHISANYTKSSRESILIGNSFAITALVLVLFQELVLKRYMSNVVGVVSQMFYLPALRVAVIIQNTITFFMTTHYIWITYILEFILMLAAYYKGYLMGLRKIR